MGRLKTITDSPKRGEIALPDLRILLKDEPNKRVLLLGNEAIARAILETGIGIVTTYPGTPASEIGDSISEIAKDANLYMEYSTNEMVAVEVAAGAANVGVRALTAMKHVGLNVAADAVMTLAYVGVKGGYVIVTADDPECYSSQNEQDNRYYALLSNLPCLEPSSPQEAKDMTLAAIEISEKLELPILLRTTTRVNHTRGSVTFGKLSKPNLKGKLTRDVKRMVMVPAHARLMHVELLKKVEKAKGISENSPYNAVTRKGKSQVGIISSSAAYNYAIEATDLLGLDASIFKVGMTNPLPEKMIGQFLRANKKIIIIEELEPYLETQIKAIAKDYAPTVEIYGKTTRQYFPRKGELSTRLVAEALAEITGKKTPIDFKRIDQAYAEIAKDLPARPPILCAGCPHRASFFVIKRVGGEKANYPTDIGCYALGIAPPLNVGDLLVCMGSGVSTAQGMSRATGEPTIAIIGDSTFFHAAIPGLVNAVYNNAKVTLAVLDNSTTAMTGHQPHPGTGITGMGSPAEKVSIEKVAEGCGVKFVKVVDPYKIKEAQAILKEALQHTGPSVVIFRAPCTLVDLREKRRKGVKIVPYRISDKCTNCMACIKLLGCPALILEDGKARVDEALCVACGLCASVCPYSALESGGGQQ
jgi:indolepyruvate ferredoxin oxidoreductase alpha subunit